LNKWILLFTITGLNFFLILRTYAFELEANPESQKLRRTQIVSTTIQGALSSNLYKNSSPDQSLNSSFSLDTSINLEDLGLTALAHLSLNKDLKGERKQRLNDAYVGSTGGLYFGDHWSISMIGLLFIPLSEDSKDNRQLTTGLYVAPVLTLDGASMDLPALRMSVRPSYRHNFHRFETALSGDSNNKSTMGLNLTLTYRILPTVTFVSRNNYNRSRTYRKNSRDQYVLEQILSWQFHTRASVSFGHVSGGTPLAANGVDTDIKFFNRNNSQIYSSIGYTF
jgi:hypothetical protein